MANLKQCPNGHYYDPNMHPTCPYCSNASASIDRSVGANYPPSVAAYDYATANPAGPSTDGSMPFGGDSSYDGGTVPPDLGSSGAVSNSFGVGSSNAFSGISYPNHRDGDTVPPEDYAGKTTIVRPIFTEQRTDSDKKDEPQQMVVGWLVAVEGPYCGKSFELHHGYTYIGRQKGDILLSKDSAVSGEKHASILYSVKNNRFKVGAGQSTNVVYLNDDELYAGSNADLKPYDQIEIGTSKFRFVPFCNDQFKW